MLVTLFVSDHLDNTVPDHDFLFPEFEIVIETEDEMTPEVAEQDESEIVESMGKESPSELHSLSVMPDGKGSQWSGRGAKRTAAPMLGAAGRNLPSTASLANILPPLLGIYQVRPGFYTDMSQEVIQAVTWAGQVHLL